MLSPVRPHRRSGARFVVAALAAITPGLAGMPGDGAPAASAWAASSSDAASAGGAPKFEFGPDDVVHPDELPELGKWMIDPDGTLAHWLDATYEGKHIREPINVILFDAGAASADEARARLEDALVAAGYPIRRGHSGGYRGWIGGTYYAQLPEEPDHAFSNRLYVLDNNHGRVFGPAPTGDGFLFIAAFSRERVAPLETLKHQYSSFDRARDDVTQQLGARSDFEIVGFVDMDNAIIDNPLVTTGDHDGQAVKLRTN